MSVVIAILLAGAGTYLLRAVFILALAGREFPPLAVRTLEYVAPAVLGALVVSFLTGAEGVAGIAGAEMAGLGCAALVAWRTRSHALTLLAGMGAFWLAGALPF